MIDLSDVINKIKRDVVLRRSREKYIKTGITSNITEALAAYLDNDAGPDEQIPLFVSSPEIHRIMSLLAQIRPACDDCNGAMHLTQNVSDPEGVKHPTAWTCKNCAIIEYSELTLAEWIEELQDEARNQKLSGADKPV